MPDNAISRQGRPGSADAQRASPALQHTRALFVDDRQVLLPLWHGLSKDDVVSFSPSLADRVALTTATSTIEETADEIASVILGDPATDSTLG